MNPTELIASLINHKATIVEGLQYVQSLVKGSMSILLMTQYGIYAARDLLGRTPIVLGEKETGFCATFESSAFLNLGYHHYRDLGAGEIVFITPERIEVLQKPREKMKICSFLWVYYGYPTSTYEGVNVECMRNRCGELLAGRDDVEVDSVARCSGFRNCTCSRVFQCLQRAVRKTVYQIYTNVAEILYANRTDAAEYDCEDEADTGTGADSG